MENFKDWNKKKEIEELKKIGEFGKAAKLETGVAPISGGPYATFADSKIPAKPVETENVTLTAVDTPKQGGIEDPLKYLRSIPTIDLTVEKQKLSENQKKIADSASEIKGQLEQLVAANNLSNNKLEERELRETIIQGIGLITGGIIGLNTGLDMGGLKFKETDWARKADKIKNDFQVKLAAMKEKYGIDDNTLQKERDLLKQQVDNKEGDFRRDLNIRSTQMDEARLRLAAQDRDKESATAQGRIETDIRRSAENYGKTVNKLRTDWENTAAQMAKLSGEGKKTAVREMERIDRDYETLTGTKIIDAPNAYIEATENSVFGAGYSDLTQMAAQRSRLIEAARKEDKTLDDLIVNRDNKIKSTIRDYVDKNMPIEEATQEAYADYKFAVTQGIKNYEDKLKKKNK